MSQCSGGVREVVVLESFRRSRVYEEGVDGSVMSDELIIGKIVNEGLKMSAIKFSLPRPDNTSQVRFKKTKLQLWILLF